MIANSSRKAVMAAAVIFGILGGSQICSAQNQNVCTYPDAQLGGIFVYPVAHANITMTVVNLTNYTLTSRPRSETPSPVVVYGASWSYPFQRISDPIKVEPYRTAIWKEGYAGPVYKPHFFGRILFFLTAPASAEFPAGWTHSFEVDMTPQDPHGGYTDQGTWVALTSSPAANVWCAENTFCGGVWSTRYMNPIGITISGFSFDMWNMMTLTSPELVVALYSPGADSIVLVVRETNRDDYFGNKLEWVDHADDDPPGTCNDAAMPEPVP